MRLARAARCTHSLAGAPRVRRRALSALAERPTPIANIAEFAAKRQTGVNMQALLSTGMGLRLEKSAIDASLPTQQRTLIQVAQFLHHELPIRLAHRSIELEELPHGLSDMPSVRTVRDWCAHAHRAACALAGHRRARARVVVAAVAGGARVHTLCPCLRAPPPPLARVQSRRARSRAARRTRARRDNARAAPSAQVRRVVQ